ncbi:SAM-dependent chlorinase/fluorinase [Haloechinothrix sp. LS1_15]|uniref:SAM hydrolase/SAM-dependent halogenase family protein n=1 Tax=Haloechinothrix sp. LS1_15 TaxID=2652248 RepID=UPI002946E35C|nr:SAM-dependent chlorinase/fluorinase [Haloechinothrix sp. LS1_15]MDV6011194.1 SAM-dependent chlorinase/fluorinase [Haloechinothrix sp. LS1_15]
MRYEWISFTTDYGLTDPFVGICHGVIGRIAPHARVIDITHGVPAGAIRHGAHTLAQSVAYLPGCVHCAVVDPGVGTARRGIALVADGGLLVGPDNGLLLPAAEALGGAREAYELTAAEYRLGEVSATFHGRDIFAPAAAHLATGVAPAALGPAVRPGELELLPEPHVRVRDGTLTAEVLTVDAFGNVQLAATEADLADAGLARDPVRVDAGTGDHTGDHIATPGRTFADVEPGRLVLLVDSAGWVALAVNRGSAAAQLGLTALPRSPSGSQERTVTLSPSATSPGASTA